MSHFLGVSIAVLKSMPTDEKREVVFDTLDFLQLWPRSLLLGFPGPDNLVMTDRARFELKDIRWKGVQCKKIISGITKDATGAALGSVEVTAYRTAANVANSELADAADGFCVSGPSGEYTIGVPNSDPHYLVGYKGGGTPVAGTTLDTLQGV